VKLLQAASGHDIEILPPIDAPTSGDKAGLSTVAAASVVHDLGNLIQIATSAINILVRTPDMPALHAGPILHRARTSLDHAGAIVRQNIGVARDRAVKKAQSNVAACLMDVAALLDVMDEAELSLEIEIAGDLPDTRCDSIGLRRAVLNLVLNARDAMAGKGIVLIQAREIEAAVELRVIDQGVGMSPTVMARVFDPFFTTKNDGLGGIGLSMVERFVRNAGGAVSIESEPGVGTAVVLRLPAIARERSLSEE
jgi:signal transduction histidine kinase